MEEVVGNEDEPSPTALERSESNQPQASSRPSWDATGTWDGSLAVFDATAGFIIADDVRDPGSASGSGLGAPRRDAEHAEMIGRIVAIVILIIAVALIVFAPIREL
jgi:hypothetical protein